MEKTNKNKVIFITGATGFIGRALTKRLLSNVQVSKLIVLSRHDSFEEYKDNARVVPVLGDVNNLSMLVRTLEEHDVTHIYHLASEAIVSTYTKHPLEAYLSTVQGVTTLLEAARVAKIKLERVLVGTSYKVYGSSTPPYNESTCFMPGNTYETAKACQDFIAQDYYRTFKVPVIIFRSVNVYGPGDSHLTRLVPKVCSDLIHDRTPTVYSSVRDSLREFIYIDDLLDALSVIEDKGEAGDVFCIGGHRETIYNIVEKICEIAEHKEKPLIANVDRAAETKEHALDDSKIKSLGWGMKVSFEEGLERTFQFYKSKPLA